MLKTNVKANCNTPKQNSSLQRIYHTKTFVASLKNPDEIKRVLAISKTDQFSLSEPDSES